MSGEAGAYQENDVCLCGAYKPDYAQMCSWDCPKYVEHFSDHEGDEGPLWKDIKYGVPSAKPPSQLFEYSPADQYVPTQDMLPDHNKIVALTESDCKNLSAEQWKQCYMKLQENLAMLLLYKPNM